MTIHFIYKKTTKWGIITELRYINSYGEIYEIDKHAIEKVTFNFLKALIKNKNFVQEIRNIRKNSAIPLDGYDILNKQNNPDDNRPGKWISELRKKIDDKLVLKLKKDYRIPNMLYSTLKDIILMNIVHLPLPKIALDVPYIGYENVNPDAIKIVINTKVDPKTLHRFIDDNWEDIEQALNKEESSEIKISDKALKILEMKDKGLTYTQIMDKLNESGQGEYYDSGSVKQLNFRTNKQINSLSSNKKKR